MANGKQRQKARQRGNGQGTLIQRGGRGPWIARWYDHNGKRNEKSTRTTDKTAAERILRKHVADAALRREGVINPDDDRYASESKRPLAEHVADFEKHLKGKSSERHTVVTMARINRIIGVAGFAALRQVTPDAVERALAAIRTDDDLSATTRNYYLTAFKMLCNWLVKQKRISSSPVAAVERLQVADREHRRALEPTEAARLVAAAEAGETLRGYNRAGKVRWELTGAQRALLYRFAWETGLRRGAIARLACADVDTGKEPAVTVKPKANTKNAKLLRIPLRRETADMLKRHCENRLPASPLFDMPEQWETADMLRADLMAARRVWIAEGQTAKERAKRAQSDFLAEQDAEERRIDFHALRTTCGTWLDVAGVSPRVAKRITGHSGERTLTRHYHRSNERQARAAVELLPVLPLLQATGTCNDDPHLHPHQQQSEKRKNTAAHRDGDRRAAQAKTPQNTGFLPLSASEGDGARTRNLRIDSPML